MLTGIVWIDWLIIAAAGVAAISTLYYKALRPFWRGARRIRVFFDKVENLFDMGEQLAPEVRNSLFATQAKLVSGHEEIMTLLGNTNDRIDSHMDAEEEALATVAEKIAEIGATVSNHMGLDEQRFDQAHQALVDGQSALVEKLTAIETAVNK